MGYKQTKPTIYVVHWPEIGVVKSGFSCNQRWRAFQLRGAIVDDLIPFDDARDAFAMESLVDRALHQFCVRRPFKSARDAEPYLGGRGGGWLECWKLPAGVTPLQILQSTRWDEVA